MTRNNKDKTIAIFLKAPIIIAVVLLALFIIILFARALPLLSSGKFIEVFTTSTWLPHDGKFGMLPFIIGTISVTILTLIIAVPIGLASSIYLSEFAPKKLRNIAMSIIDILSAIPSIIYGACGVIVCIPAVKWLGTQLNISTSGRCLLTASIVLAAMIIPVIIAISKEVFASIPNEARESLLALGATRWETTRYVVIKLAFPGIIAAVILGMSRAFGETMAVMMVAGSSIVSVPKLFEPIYTLPALIADKYGEMMSVEMYEAALMTAALVLMIVVAVANLIAYFIMQKLK